MELNSTKHTLNKNDYISLSLLFMMSFFLFADQNLMGPNLTQIANDFGFNSTARSYFVFAETKFSCSHM